MARERSVRGALAVTTATSFLLAYMGNHLGSALDDTELTSIDAIGDWVAGAAAQVPAHVLAQPLALDADGLAPVATLLLSVVPWCAFLGWLSSSSAGDRPDGQYGSSKWAVREDLELFATAGNPDPRNVLILSKHYGLAVSRRGYDRTHDRNLNVFVIGGSGSGKTRYFVKPNVCQMFGNYFITDPKGTLLPDVGQMLVDNGYTVVCFDTNIISNSLVYNPFACLKTDLDVLMFVDSFMALTTDQRKSGGDQFWDDTTRLLFCALICYLRDWCPPSDYNFGGLLRLLDMAEVKEENEDYESPLDLLFKELETGLHRQPTLRPSSLESRKARVVEGVAQTQEAEEGVPSTRVNNTTGARPGRKRLRRDGSRRRGLDQDEDFSLRLYRRFKLAAGKTLKSILISTAVKLTAIMTSDVQGILCGDDQMHLELLADPNRKYAFFDTFQDTNQQTLGFIHGLLAWQAIQICCKAADSGTGKLKRPVQFILDEYKSLNLPKQVSDMISVVRSRNIALCVIVQDLEQMYSLYDEHDANSIVGCCDTILYLGGSGNQTNKELSEFIGQMTVNDKTTSVSHQGLFGGSYSVNESRHARALIDASELSRLDRGDCIVMIKGTDFALDEKYPLEDHPRYSLVDPGHDPLVTKRLFGKIPIKKVRAAYSEPFDLKKYMKERPMAASGGPEGVAEASPDEP